MGHMMFCFKVLNSLLIGSIFFHTNLRRSKWEGTGLDEAVPKAERCTVNRKCSWICVKLLHDMGEIWFSFAWRMASMTTKIEEIKLSAQPNKKLGWLIICD